MICTRQVVAAALPEGQPRFLPLNVGTPIEVLQAASGPETPSPTPGPPTTTSDFESYSDSEGRCLILAIGDLFLFRNLSCR